MISIITPTFNRAYILKNAYISLQNQTSQQFEWIIVDDGSTDDTQELVQKWQRENNLFEIIYFKQENGGKHRALNNAVQHAKYDYTLILDSDDELIADAVYHIHVWIDHIKELSGFAGVAGLRGWKQRNGVVGDNNFKAEYVDATNLQRKKFHLTGDKAEVYKTELLKKYPFPEFEGEKFLSESAVWNKIAADGYKIRWFNKIIYRCDYLEDGLTKNSGVAMNLKNFQGFTYCVKLDIKLYPFLIKYFKIGYYKFVARQAGKNNKEICTLLNINKIQLALGAIVYRIKMFLKR